MKLLATAATAMFAVLTLGQAFAASPEDTIRQTLNERIPQLTKIDEVRTTPMQGLYEVRVGTDVFYTDAQGNYLIQGELIDTQARRNLTEDRIKALTAVKFSDLPLNDAIKVVHGKGERQIAVFADPNCGYCKRFERDMQSVDNVTMHVFLIPILSPDSVENRAISGAPRTRPRRGRITCSKGKNPRLPPATPKHWSATWRLPTSTKSLAHRPLFLLTTPAYQVQSQPKMLKSA